MSKSGRTITLLAFCQALLLTNNVVNIGMNGLVGYAFAANKAWATLPVAAYTIGTALSTVPASLWMRRVGRRAGFITGSFFGICGMGLFSLAALKGSFWLLVLGGFVTGFYNAFGQYYRFAAAEAVGEAWRSRAIAFVLGGGIGGAVLGPEISIVAKDALIVPYLGAYLFLAGCALLAALLQLFVDIPTPPAAQLAAEEQRPLRVIAAQPLFQLAVLGAMVGYAVMTFLMTATPLAMVAMHHTYAVAAFVVEWHVVAMFAPSFFTGSLIRRYGERAVMGAGAVLMLGTAAVALSGNTVPFFWVALVLLGTGWNFLYIGGTSLLTRCYRPAERAKAQGTNDLLVFTASGTASFLSGVVLHRIGWHGVVIGTLPLLALVLAALLWAGMTMRGRTLAAPR